MQRQTKIIATLGPATHNEETLKQMLPYIDMVRLNFSWGTYVDMLLLIGMIRKVAAEAGKKIEIIQDLSGPRKQEISGHSFDGNTSQVITEKDIQDLKFGVENNVDYVAMSYVGSATDVTDLRGHMISLGKQIPIIAKIERVEAVKNIQNILEVSDAIMIARGDLGQAFPIEEIPFIERKILSLCKNNNKFVIVATEMMLSMVENERPTRAEVTDVAFAVMGGVSAVMLSEETSIGKHPVEVVTTMDKIVRYAEEHKNL